MYSYYHRTHTIVDPRMPSINALVAITVKDNGEPLIDLKHYGNAAIKLVPSSGQETIFVRQTVGEKILAIQEILLGVGVGLYITDGYRSLEIQQHLWDEQVKINMLRFPEYTKEQIDDITCDFVARPDISMHSTGGAIDVTLYEISTGKLLPMGGQIDAFDESSHVDYAHLHERERNHRQLLYHHMTQEGFYSLPTEWRHFSYGTREWAAYYHKECAIYDVISCDVY